MTRRRRNLRGRLFAAAIAVAVAPFVFLVGMSRWEIFQVAHTEEADLASAARISERLEREGVQSALELSRDVARETLQRIRIFSGDGQVLADLDGALTAAPGSSLEELLYGPVRPGLETYEAESGALMSRTEVASGESERFSPGGNLLVHAVARFIPTRQLWVHVRGHTRRAVLPEVAQTRQLVKLASAATGVALVVAWILARRLFGPIEQLRTELLDRATTAVPRSGIDLGRRDELGDLADAFNAVLAALAERTRTSEAFLSDLAHEFKNPVATVRTCAELLSKGGVSEERAAKLTAALQQSSLQLDRLVTQFLELARAEAGLPSEGREPVRIAALGRGLQSRFSEDPRFSEVSWRTTGFDSNASVLGVSIRLERAIGNLILNALTFAGQGGWIDVRILESGEFVEISVQDSGPGIQASDLPRVFDRFFTTRQEQSGTGLGLALTRAIVEAHGGRISVESPPGGGARFSVLLPMAQSEV